MAKIKNPKFIDGDPTKGIKYDYKKINKLYNSLECPDFVYNPTTVPIDKIQYAILMSDRMSGKTTNWLLYGLCMHWLYGTVIQYVRQSQDDIAPIASRNLFDVILEYKYIEKLTDGKYNSVYYKARRWYLARYNDQGEIEEVAEDNFMFMCAVLDQEKLKSSYNCPTGDLLIFDEFISKYYYPDEFIDLCNLTSTIFRFRHSPKVIMLANTIEKHSPYYNELMIYDDIQEMMIGDSKRITTPGGTNLYVELIGMSNKRAEKKSVISKLFYGFESPKLASITGVDWAMDEYQHIPKRDDSVEQRTLINNLYVYYNNKYVRCDIVQRSDLGTCMFVHWATRTYPDSVILTVDHRTDGRFQYRFGEGKVYDIFIKLLKENKIYYTTNDVGNFFCSYCKLANKSYNML